MNFKRVRRIYDDLDVFPFELVHIIAGYELDATQYMPGAEVDYGLEDVRRQMSVRVRIHASFNYNINPEWRLCRSTKNGCWCITVGDQLRDWRYALMTTPYKHTRDPCRLGYVGEWAEFLFGNGRSGVNYGRAWGENDIQRERSTRRDLRKGILYASMTIQALHEWKTMKSTDGLNFMCDLIVICGVCVLVGITPTPPRPPGMPPKKRKADSTKTPKPKKAKVASEKKTKKASTKKPKTKSGVPDIQLIVGGITFVPSKIVIVKKKKKATGGDSKKVREPGAAKKRTPKSKAGKTSTKADGLIQTIDTLNAKV